MSQQPARAKKGSAGAATSLDLRQVPTAEVRSRAFSGLFRFKPGQRVAVLVAGDAAEKEIRQWVAEVGHRLIKVEAVADGEEPYRTVEIVKMEARR